MVGSRFEVPALSLVMRHDGSVVVRNQARDLHDEVRKDMDANYKRELKESDQNRESAPASGMMDGMRRHDARHDAVLGPRRPVEAVDRSGRPRSRPDRARTLRSLEGPRRSLAGGLSHDRPRETVRRDGCGSGPAPEKSRGPALTGFFVPSMTPPRLLPVLGRPVSNTHLGIAEAPRQSGEAAAVPIGTVARAKPPDSRLPPRRQVRDRRQGSRRSSPRAAKGGRVGKAQNAHDPLDPRRVGSGHGRRVPR